jgi:hypothetical protein
MDFLRDVVAVAPAVGGSIRLTEIIGKSTSCATSSAAGIRTRQAP